MTTQGLVLGWMNAHGLHGCQVQERLERRKRYAVRMEEEAAWKGKQRKVRHLAPPTPSLVHTQRCRDVYPLQCHWWANGACLRAITVTSRQRCNASPPPLREVQRRLVAAAPALDAGQLSGNS